MLHIIKGTEKSKAPDLMAEMFRLRYQIFVKGRGWTLPTRSGHETDQYDVDDAVYIIDRAADGRIVGSVRLTPTDRHSLLADYFPHLVAGGSAPRDPSVYEATRYIVQPLLKSVESNRQAKARIIGAALSWCARNGISRLQTVIDTELLPTFLEMSPRVDPMGLSHPYGGGREAPGGGECLAITVPVTDEVLADVLSYGHLGERDLLFDVAA